MADKSVDVPARSHPLFHFEKKFIGSFNNSEYMTIKTWVEKSKINPTSDLLLQMDIEGSEYEVVLSMPYNCLQFTYITKGMVQC